MVPSDQRASRCREKYAEIVRRKGPAKLLNNGAAWRRQRRLLADSTRLRRHRRPLRPSKSAAETPKPRRNAALAARIVIEGRNCRETTGRESSNQNKWLPGAYSNFLPII